MSYVSVKLPRGEAALPADTCPLAYSLPVSGPLTPLQTPFPRRCDRARRICSASLGIREGDVRWSCEKFLIVNPGGVVCPCVHAVTHPECPHFQTICIV